MTITQAASLLLGLGIGPKEAAVLGIIADLDGNAQVQDLRRKLSPGIRDPRGLLRSLILKRLVVKVEAPTGWPTYKLTTLAKLKLP